MPKITSAEARHAFQVILKDPGRAVHYAKQVRKRIFPKKATGEPPFKEDVPGIAGAIGRARDDGRQSLLFVLGTAKEKNSVPKGAAICTLNMDLVRQGWTLFSEAAIDDDSPDAIIVGSTNKQDYSNVLRTLKGLNKHLPVYTDRTGFEWIGSDIPIFSGAEDHVLYFHHYLAENFGLRDPIQVVIDVIDAGEVVSSFHRILGPNETFIVDETQLGLSAKKDAYVTSRCWHPRLTFGRHRRMRIAADVLSNGAVATLHSSHAFGPAGIIQGQLTAGEESRLFLTVPDYPGWNESGKPVNLRVGSGNGLQQLEFAGRLNQEVDLTALGPGTVQYMFQGQAGGFWYRQGDGVLAANHHVTTMFEAAPPTPLSDAEVQRLKELEGTGLFFLPHGLPVPRPEERLHAAFSCKNSIPLPRKFRLVWFDEKGQLVDKTSWEYDGELEFIHANDLDPQLAAKCEGGLVMVSPDWEDSRLNPARQGFYADFVLREMDGNDFDFTEFQDSWMNLQGYVQDFPRWMFPPGVNTARSNVVMRGVTDGTLTTQFLVVIGSGDLNFSKSGTMEIWFYRPDGRALRTERTVEPWTYSIWDLDELFPELKQFCPDGRGYVRVRSTDIDSKIYGITRRKGGGIGVQHFWGY